MPHDYVHTDKIKMLFPHSDIKLTWKLPDVPFSSLLILFFPLLFCLFSICLFFLSFPFLLFLLLLNLLLPFLPAFHPFPPSWLIIDLAVHTDINQVHLKAFISRLQPAKLCQQIPQRMMTLVPGRIARRDSHLSPKLFVLSKVLTQMKMRPSWGTTVLGLYIKNIIRFPESSTMKCSANKSQKGFLLTVILGTNSAI